jgi:hypothetical protein
MLISFGICYLILQTPNWDELESDDEDEPVECALKPLQHPLIIKHQPQGRRRQEKRKWSLSRGGGQTAP